MSTAERLERLAKRVPTFEGPDAPAHLLPPPHKTWAEHLRSMSDEDLLELLGHFKQVAPERQAYLESLSLQELHAMLEGAR